MLKHASFLMLLLVSSAPLLSQLIPASVPLPDYDVYTAVTNRFTEGDREGRLLTKPLLFIEDQTVGYGTHSFEVDFRDLESRSLAPFPRTDSPLQTPEWAAFIASVDTSQFTRRRLKRLPRVAGYKAKFWTPSLSNYYFTKGSPRRGFFDVRRDYKQFTAIIAYSQVAYSPEGHKALCCYSEVSDGLAGSGSLVFLEKKAGRWQVVDVLMLWIS